MFKAGETVRYSSNGRIGEITGKYRERTESWQVLFDAVDLMYIPAEKLERVSVCKDVYDLFQDFDFQGISDYRRRLYRYRMSGELTNIMYSMDNAVAEFMPHQFIPVIKFLESYTDRLLIADEVGLGKTIEAMYIWEEIRARKNAKKLLIVVPAVLRDKWKNDIRRFFNINAEIVSAEGKNKGRTLLSSILEAREDSLRTTFSLIVSLEGVRVAKEVRRVLKESRDAEMLFDMVIIDEAHYLRNESTEAFKMGELLRDVSNHMLLLSATPIQTSSKNFFNLLRLLAPEDFSYAETFETQLLQNWPLVRISNALEQGDSAKTIVEYVEEALANDVFADDHDLQLLKENLDEIIESKEQRMHMVDSIKRKYFYDSLVTRTRKRDVFPNRVRRNVVSVNFRLNDYERNFYERVSVFLQNEAQQSTKNQNFSTFRLIARQRQMASSIPAALRSWRGLGVDDDFDETIEAESNRENARMFSMPSFDEFDLEKLESTDSKLERVIREIHDRLAENPKEKIVIFSFFRNTVRYLYDKIMKEGISVTYIMGGMGQDLKMSKLEQFSSGDINILVSSEVGSEGIDLQFARYELNYDLPWNPMRLEQRIGRIDRIGQKSKDIYICNAYCENTIEDRILHRLYHRIEVFRNIIGDLEEILGEKVQDLEIDVFNRRGKMTEAEIDESAEQVIKAMLQRQKIENALELQVGNMASPYQAFVLSNINKAYNSRRLLQSEELMYFCRDVLQEKFHGSSVIQYKEGSVAEVKLSDVARRELTTYMANVAMIGGTKLNHTSSGLYCNFGKKIADGIIDVNIDEVVDMNHPLIKWLLNVVEKSAIYSTGCEVASLKKSKLPSGIDLESGYYSYAVQRWEANGVRRVNELKYYMLPAEYNPNQSLESVISSDIAENVLVSLIVDGEMFDINLLSEEDYNACGYALEHISRVMEDDFARFYDEQRIRNKNLVEEQSRYVEHTASIKIGKIETIVRRMQESSSNDRNKNLIVANNKRIENIRIRRDVRIAKIKDKLDCIPISEDVVVGILKIEDM